MSGDARIVACDGMLKIYTPSYEAGLVNELHRLFPAADHTFRKGAWLVDAVHAREVNQLVRGFFPTVRQETDPTPRRGRIQFTLQYLGRCKDDGLASALVDDEWIYKIPDTVLQDYFGSTSGEETYYTRLGCRRDDSLDELRYGYYQAAKVWHPDHNRDADAPVKFQQVADAYRVLSDPVDRAKYDKGLLLAEMLREMQSGVSRRSLKKKQAGYRAPRTCGVLDAEVSGGIKQQRVTKIYKWEPDVRVVDGHKVMRVSYMRYEKRTGEYNLVTEWEATW